MSSAGEERRAPQADVIVVGGGACGGWAALQLTQAGMNVVLLEAGPFIAPSLLPSLETAHAPLLVGHRERQPIQSRCYIYRGETAGFFVDDLDHPYVTPRSQPFHWFRSRVLGGRTTVWARMIPRMSDHELQAASKDGWGIDWPLTSQDLAPHYNRVEGYFGARGTGAEPHLRWRSFTPVEQHFKTAIETRWPRRRVTLCAYVPLFAPDRVPGDRDPVPRFCSAASMIPEALLTGRLKLRCDSIVEKVLLDATGRRARAVRFVDRLTHQRREIQGRVILLCASTLESTRLLLASACPQHPRGLGNRSGVLGHYLMDHTSGIYAVGRSPRPPAPLPAGDLGLYITGFHDDGAEPRFQRGYAVQATVGYPHPGGGNGCDFTFFGEMLPRFENQASLDPDVVDAWGIPALHITCRHGDNEVEMARHQVAAAHELLAATGYAVESIDTKLGPPGGAIHEAGTARMGHRPTDSVLDSNNRVWDLTNVFVTDGAAFPSIGFQNPTLTMLALTGRACDQIVAECRRGEL